MGAVLYILLGWLLTVLACYAAGALLLSRMAPLWSRQEAVALRFISGAGVYGVLIFLCGLLPIYSRALFVAWPLLLAAAAWRTGAFRLPEESLPDLPAAHRRILWIMAPFAVLYLANAMAPEVSPDGSSYHLGLIAKYYRDRTLTPITVNLYAALSQGMEMLFLSAFSIGRHSASALVHFTYLLTLPWLLLCFARRYAMPSAGVAAALLVFCSPVVGLDGISAYNDVAAACLYFALFQVLRRMEEHPEARGLWVLAGVLGGAAYGLKYTLAPALILAALWIGWLHRRRALCPLAVLSASALPFVAPWIVRNTLWWHNPLAPFFNKWFPNPFVQPWFEAEYRLHMAKYSLTSFTQLPLEVTVHGASLNGLLGPIFLLTPLALLALRTREGRRLLLAAAFALSTYPSNIGTRFLIPALPFLALALGQTLSYVRWLPFAVVALHAALSWPDVIPAYANRWAWRLEKIVWKDALRVRDSEHYLVSHLPAYPLTRRLDELVPPGRRILGFGQIPEAYSNRDYLVAFQSAEGNRLRDIILTPLVLESQPTRRVRLQFPSTRQKKIRIVQNRNDPGGQWFVTEAHLFSGDREIIRSPHWRLRAQPSNYNVQSAFDNSFVTRWASEEGRYAGMFIEVDFGENETLDHVDLTLSPDQPWDTFHVEVPGAAPASWTRLQTQVKMTDLVAPVGLRRAAIEELLLRNIEYLITAESDYAAADFYQNRAIWGLEPLAEAGAYRLFRLQSTAEYQNGGKERK